MKKYCVLYVIFVVAFVICIHLYDNKPPVINSMIGSKTDLSMGINTIEKYEKIKIIETGTDYAKNEITYEIYNSKDFSIDKINYLTSLNSFVIDYDNNEKIEKITFNFSLNYKSSLEVLEMLIRTTFIELTDAGYEAISKYMNINTLQDKKEKYKPHKYTTSNKTLSLSYNEESNEFIFTVE